MLFFRWDNENDVDDDDADEVDAENDKKTSDGEDDDGSVFYYVTKNGVQPTHPSVGVINHWSEFTKNCGN